MIRLMLGFGRDDVDDGEISLDNDKSVEPHIIADISDMSFINDNSIDYIFMSQILIYNDNDKIKLMAKEISRILKPSGSFEAHDYIYLDDDKTPSIKFKLFIKELDLMIIERYIVIDDDDAKTEMITFRK